MPHGFAIPQAADRLPVHLDVGDDVDLRQALDEPAAVLLDRCPIEVSETATECNQVLVTERLTANKQH